MLSGKNNQEILKLQWLALKSNSQKNNLKSNSERFSFLSKFKKRNIFWHTRDRNSTTSTYMLTTILERVILLKSFLSFMNIALERLFVKYIIYVYIQSFLYILCLGTIPILRKLKNWVGEWVGSENCHFCWRSVLYLCWHSGWVSQKKSKIILT